MFGSGAGIGGAIRERQSGPKQGHTATGRVYPPSTRAANDTHGGTETNTEAHGEKFTAWLLMQGTHRPDRKTGRAREGERGRGREKIDSRQIHSKAEGRSRKKGGGRR